MNLKETFKKQGGMKLLKQYWKGGALFTAAGEFLLLGKSRTALEILRLSAGLKIKQKLEKQYRKYITTFDEDWKKNDCDHTLKHESSNKVWICWFQGMENAPELVQRCYRSVKENIVGKEIVVITEENYRDYVEFPSFIQRKVELGIISKTHLSDLLRLELLIKYGGTWMDATILCTGMCPDYMLNSDLFVFQNLKPGLDGHSTALSNWFISAKSNNCILKLTLFLLYEYWNKNDELVNYFIFHIFFQLACEKYSEEWSKVVPFSNSTPHILLLRLFEQYDENIWNAVKTQTPLHKLTYKFDKGQEKLKYTYYDVILGE
jgi:hypothetical protein